MKTYGELMEAVAAVRSPTRRTVKPTAAAEKSPHYTGNALGIRALNHLRNGLSENV